MINDDLEYVRKQLLRHDRVRGRLTEISAAVQIHRLTLSRIKSGVAMPRVSTLIKLQKFLKMLEKSGVETPINNN